MLRLNDWFCGAGGSTQGASSVPGVQPVHAANHWAQAIESHAVNFPEVDHWKGDIRDLDVAKLPYAEIFWASPECTNWSRAKGKAQDYAVTDTALPGLEDPAMAEEVERSRALMEEVPLYLRAMSLRGRPVLAGVVENVTDIRAWVDHDRWRREIEDVGYRTRLIALNSMHAQSVRTPRAPQSRDRYYLAYWHVSLGRDPEWDRWLRPRAWCSTCEEWVQSMQSWKRPGVDMGRYRQQYVYRCPRSTCRNQVVEPEFAPAWTAVDWSLRGTPIGDRPNMATKTKLRVRGGIQRYARPVVIEAGGHQYDAADPKHPQHGTDGGYLRAWPVDSEPLKALHTSLTKGVVVPPLLVPVEGRDGKQASTIGRPLRTQSTRSETALVVPPLVVPAGGSWNDTAQSAEAPLRALTTRESGAVVVPPFIAELRGGGSLARPASQALATLTASGYHHGVVVPPLLVRQNGGEPTGWHATPMREPMRTLTTGGHQSLVSGPDVWDAWAAVYAYDTGSLRHVADPLPTQTTRQGDALVTGQLLDLSPADWDRVVDECLFRMLEPAEIGAGMAFRPDYVVLGNRRQQTRQYGNAVTPPVAEVLVAALVECITGEQLDLQAA
jgi:DNA (cytosine-5)-methyltransferase 1